MIQQSNKCPDCGAYSPDHIDRPFRCGNCGSFFPELSETGR
jgi:ribosomal protein S27AE